MADQSGQIESKEKEAVAPKKPEAPRSSESPQGLDTSRKDIAGTLETGTEGEESGGELMDTGEKVSEGVAEGREQKGDSAGGKQKGDDDQKKDDGTAATTFTFDEGNLPPAPEMIKRIESQLRKDIHQLEKKARRYQGGLFRKPDYPKYSETMVEMRKKTVLLRRLVSLAGDALKKMFVQMFSAKKSK